MEVQQVAKWAVELGALNVFHLQLKHFKLLPPVNLCSVEQPCRIAYRFVQGSSPRKLKQNLWVHDVIITRLRTSACIHKYKYKFGWVEIVVIGGDAKYEEFVFKLS